MNLERIVIAGVNPTKDFQQQRKIKDALKKIAELAKRIVGHDVEFDFAYDAIQVAPTSCDLLLVVGKNDERGKKAVVNYRTYNVRGEVGLIDPTSRYSLTEQIYITFLSWIIKQSKRNSKLVA